MLRNIMMNGIVYSYTALFVIIYLAITAVGLTFLGSLVYYLMF
ncbi:MAG TPA: hypothetical protein VHS59_13520 [Bacillota bacterium]|nr:hypothetical protein [Bacillota bacterium]